jgi:asparagine synthase (glutamine-hydrolysing)
MLTAAHGAWSVVLIDLAQKRALAAVDRFAMRPLCFTAAGGVFSFASRADEVPGGRGEIDAQAIYDYAYHHFIPAPRTIFRDVRRLDAAHRCSRPPRASASRATGSRASRRSNSRSRHGRSYFLGALTGAVSDQLQGETIGCYLSGGTDSSTVTGMVTQMTQRPVKTFSIGFDAAGYDEMEYARIAARQYHSDHHEYYITPDDLIERHPVRCLVVRSAIRQLVGATGLFLREARARRRRDAHACRRRRRRALRRQLALCERQAVYGYEHIPAS